MNDAELLIARMRLAAEIDAKFKLVDQLRNRCMQKIEEIQHNHSEAEIVENVDANAKLKELHDQLADADPAFATLETRYRKSDVNNLADQRFDRAAPAMLKSLERLQSVFEAELLVLDDLMNQLEGRSGS
jgi:molybdopterin converting factor small subunit